MTRTCGVRFIRLKSSGVSGCESGSLRAAACRSSSLIASRRLQSCLAGVLLMILASFIGLRRARRDDANAIVSHRIRHQQETVPGHAENCPAFFAVVVPVVYLLNRERVLKHVACGV